MYCKKLIVTYSSQMNSAEVLRPVSVRPTLVFASYVR